ncbi:ATP-binding cassette domain-containing protein [Xylophilus rhododendri]|uniref:ATP-binding cassette domain-containing protein n=1 Tax=Xylophilus rhododendri TaxID=2697032 RepID=A0A857J1G9_9BURK|nr:ABC transporter ATP-binding protein [Xylophilus rhododendri]QHI96725.1 ATP-binding cassette domain-containing protein [Xylophilus rhododendri]
MTNPLKIAVPQETAAAAAQAGRPLLQVRQVSIDYRLSDRAVRAVHQVSLDVHEGDRFILLGASGCGKSSLLKAIGGFIPTSEGSIELAGRQVQKAGPDRAMVFQEFDQLPPWLTVQQNVAFPLRATGVKRREAAERAFTYIEKVGLARFADAYPHQLSGGMKQRVAIARALALQPRVLLMDEPFAALDALTRQRMQQELLELWAEFRFTLVFVTHAIDEALLLGSRIAVLSPHPGRLRAEIDASRFDAQDIASPDFRAATQRIHCLLFEQAHA